MLAVCDCPKQQVVLAWDVPQLPVCAVVHRKILVVEVDGVDEFEIEAIVVALQPRQLRWEHQKIPFRGKDWFGPVADLVDMFFEGAFQALILRSHRIEPFCKSSAY